MRFSLLVRISLTLVMMTAFVVFLFLPRRPSRVNVLENERAAIAAMQDIVRIENQYVKDATTDKDGNGRGEFAFLNDLSAHNLLPPSFASVGSGLYESNGYWFCVFLQCANGQEKGDAWTNYNRDSVLDYLAEYRWICFAWPARLGCGTRAFAAVPGQLLEASIASPDGDLAYCGKRFPVPHQNFFPIGFTVTLNEVAWTPLK